MLVVGKPQHGFAAFEGGKEGGGHEQSTIGVRVDAPGPVGARRTLDSLGACIATMTDRHRSPHLSPLDPATQAGPRRRGAAGVEDPWPVLAPSPVGDGAGAGSEDGSGEKSTRTRGLARAPAPACSGAGASPWGRSS